MPNRLANSNSPYLLQHADNPVDWFPWGSEALEKAHREDKPIFLSVGYAACHWCHVMAHESFQDPNIAVIMNRHFINIKVDREERPDLDSIYMNAVVAMTGQGGWPMSVFLTPDGQPFYGGTYFPPMSRFNIPSFREILLSVARIWEENRSRILQAGEQITAHLKSLTSMGDSIADLNIDSLEQASLALAGGYDWKGGGWGKAPKFPQPMAIEFLLRRAWQGDKLALEMASHALHAMAKGGMYDVVGGGFARYSTDNEWLIPHFEKMLYDNAQLAIVYLHAYLLTGDLFFRRICEETLMFIEREMTHPLGGFYSSLDADSEGQEGKYYLWTTSEISEVIRDPIDFDFFSHAYGLNSTSNFGDHWILQRARDDMELSVQYSLDPAQIANRLSRLHQLLLQFRGNRVRPGTDDKVLVSWNALMLLVFSEVGRYLGSSRCVEMAIRNANFLLSSLRIDGQLYRSWRNGQAVHSAYLEDYAALILGLLSLYQTEHNHRWFSAALELTNEMISHFRDPQRGFFDTRDDQELLILRPKDIQDNAIPSGNSLATTALLLMSAYQGHSDWREIASSMIAPVLGLAIRHPTAFSTWLCAAHLSVYPITEVAILGQSEDPATQQMINVLWSRFRPDLVAAISPYPPHLNSPLLLSERILANNKPTAYVCHSFVCHQPVTSAVELESQLKTL